MTNTEIAQVLEDAADLLLIHGVRRDGTAGTMEWGSEGSEGETPLCAYGALCVAAPVSNEQLRGLETVALDALEKSIFGNLENVNRVFEWNDATTDDFEVIDALRHTAKDLRNSEV